MKNIIYITCIMSLLLFCNQTYWQHIPLSDKKNLSRLNRLIDKINNSDIVVEGMVINEPRLTGCFRGTQGSPFISNIIRVTRVFKGRVKDTLIEVVTDGGAFMWGVMAKGQEGIFLLRPNNTTIQSGKNIQSFFFLYPNAFMLYRYIGSPYHAITTDNIRKYDVEKELYPAIEAITDTPPKVVGLNSVEIRKAKNNRNKK